MKNNALSMPIAVKACTTATRAVMLAGLLMVVATPVAFAQSQACNASLACGTGYASSAQSAQTQYLGYFSSLKLSDYLGGGTFNAPNLGSPAVGNDGSLPYGGAPAQTNPLVDAGVVNYN